MQILRFAPSPEGVAETAGTAETPGPTPNTGGDAHEDREL
jgi:hypothetical protein